MSWRTVRIGPKPVRHRIVVKAAFEGYCPKCGCILMTTDRSGPGFVCPSCLCNILVTPSKHKKEEAETFG